MIMTGMNVTEFKYILTRAVHEPSRSFTDSARRIIWNRFYLILMDS